MQSFHTKRLAESFWKKDCIWWFSCPFRLKFCHKCNESLLCVMEVVPIRNIECVPKPKPLFQISVLPIRPVVTPVWRRIFCKIIFFSLKLCNNVIPSFFFFFKSYRECCFNSFMQHVWEILISAAWVSYREDNFKASNCRVKFLSHYLIYTAFL